jgi:hypothetical protein
MAVTNIATESSGKDHGARHALVVSRPNRSESGVE